MKRIYLRFFIFIVFVCLPIHSYAHTAFSPVPGTPLEFSGSYTGWTELKQMQPTVRYEGGTYRMWYASVGEQRRKIAYAISGDGVHWERKALFDFFPGDDVGDPFMLKDDTGYRLYFSRTVSGQPTRIVSIKSSDGFTFDLSTLRIDIVPGSGWDRYGATAPLLLQQGQDFAMVYTGNNGKWVVGVAAAQNGAGFEKCTTNPLPGFSDNVPRGLLIHDETVQLYFPSPQGTEVVETPYPVSCSSVWVNKRTVLSGAYYVETAFSAGSDTKLIYTTGTSYPPFLYITSSVPQQKKPVVLIPGMFASWNREALLHNVAVSPLDWVLNPFVTEYTGLSSTLEKLGYQAGKDYFVFPYDWRADVRSSAENLHTFLTSHRIETNANLVGHSLGGVVAAQYKNLYGTEDTNVVTVGSPLKGTALAYRAYEGGEIETNDGFMWLAQKTVLQLNKKTLQTDRDTIIQVFPVAQNLLPIFPYIKNDDTFIDTGTMIERNNLNLAVHPDLIPIGGTGKQTLRGYEVGPRTWYDKMLNLYPDGRPTATLTDDGDGTVLRASAGAWESQTQLPYGHGELIYKKEAIATILNKLNIANSDHEIIEGAGTVLRPSILVLLASPARVTVSHEQTSIRDQDGLIFTPSAGTGTYELTLEGISSGPYTLYVAQFGTNTDKWNKIEGVIPEKNPQNYRAVFDLAFDAESPKSDPQPRDPRFYREELRLLISRAFKNSKSKPDYLRTLENRMLTRSSLIKVHAQLFHAFIRSGDTVLRNDILDIISKIESLYGLLPADTKQQSRVSNREVNRLRERLTRLEQETERKKNVDRARVILLFEMRKRLDILRSDRYPSASGGEILLRTVDELFKAI